VFKALDLDKLSKEDPRFLLDSFTTRMGKGQPVPPEHFVNDLEPPAFQCIPDLKKIKDRLLVRCVGSPLVGGGGGGGGGG
jgi:4-diphosphocytidyl-2-C-methyl-D-erythritol kinase